jgi:hypothetical protein
MFCFENKSVEKYKSCVPKAKIVVVGAILNYSAILKFEKKICSMIFSN